MKVLVAEDDVTYQRILAKLLAKWGYEPIVVRDGEEAWATLQAPDPPRLVLLDWMMPGLNGLEVCRQIRSRKSVTYTYVLMLTGKAEVNDAITALESGADDFVAKPCNPHELRARISTLRRILDLEESLVKQAHFDELTGVPNRELLSKIVRNRVEQDGPGQDDNQGDSFGLLFVDLDGFKLVNDSFGHAAGDTLLKAVVARLSDCLSTRGTLARIGGDEFVVFASDFSIAEDAGSLAEELLRSLEEPIPIGGEQVYTSASIGISLYPRDGSNFHRLLENADAAMYSSKRKTRNSYAYFQAEMIDSSRRRLETESQIRGALEKREFLLFYQPIVKTEDLRIAGCEALIRWKHPQRGMVPPSEFIPIAEETGQIIRIGAWVLEEACTQSRLWKRRTGEELKIAVNVGGAEFSRADYVASVAKTLARTGANPQSIELELTETVLVRDLKKSADTMKALRDLGLRLAIDDFGTGYSSFSYLANLPIDTLKIDKSLLCGIEASLRRATVLESIVDLAHKLGIKVIAEGIETTPQLEAVAAAGCDEVQGYLLSRPAPLEQLDFTRGAAQALTPLRDLSTPIPPRARVW